MANHLEGKVIVVTGAAGGFGRLVSQKTAARGARIVACDINAAQLDTTVSLIEAEGGEATAIVADVTNRAQMMAMAEAAVAGFGSIDVIVNNAGVMPLAFFADHEAAADAWDLCIDINLKGVLHGIMAVHDQMIE
ncbi:MAG: SDR family NAD(P)-dependent oxidoreductase, partial [bacterium]